MRKFLATAAIVAISSSAFAGGSLDVRADFKGTSVYKNAANVDQDSTGGLTPSRGRLNFNGKVNDSVTTKAQFDFVEEAALFSVIKYAEVTHKWSDMFALTVGKLDDTGTGGYEARRNSGEMYFKSASYLGNYYTGGRADLSFSEAHNLGIFVMNEQFNVGSTSTKLGYGLNYDGHFGSFGVQASYHAVPQVNGSQSNTYMALGGMFKTDAMKITLDYLGNTYTKLSNDGTKDGTKSSIVVMFDYDLGMFEPNVKVESSTITNLNTSYGAANNAALATYGATIGTGNYTAAITQYSLGVNYKPFPADKFNYHLEYVGASTVFDGAGVTATNKTVTTTTVYAGLTMVADLWK